MQKARWRRALSWRDGRTGVRWRVARQVASEPSEVWAGGEGMSCWSEGRWVAAEVIGAVGRIIGGRRGGGRRPPCTHLAVQAAATAGRSGRGSCALSLPLRRPLRRGASDRSGTLFPARAHHLFYRWPNQPPPGRPLVELVHSIIHPTLQRWLPIPHGG